MDILKNRMDICKAFEELCSRGDIEGVKQIWDDPKYDIFARSELIVLGAHEAARYGTREIVDYMIQRGADVNLGLDGACEGGRRDFVDLMIQLGADDFNFGLHGACYGGHLELAEYMVQLGATDFQYGLIRACEGGHCDLAEYMIQCGANRFFDPLLISYRNKHVHLLKFFSKFVKLSPKYKKFLKIYAHKNLIKLELALKQTYIFPELKRMLFEYF